MKIPSIPQAPIYVILGVVLAALWACAPEQVADAAGSPDVLSDPATNRQAEMPFDTASELAAVEAAIRGMIGWAQDKDFDLLYSIPVHDSTYLSVHPGDNVVKGYEDFLEGVEFFRSPDFRAVRYEVSDLQINFSPSGDVAWYFCMLDDENEYQGAPASWMNTRWTGVLEKREGRWRMMQMHFSFAEES